MNPQDMDYNQSGFDNFMSRDIENNPQTNLDSPYPPNNAVAFDRTQVTGFQGDTFKVGPVRITNQGIIMTDENGNDVLLMGNDNV